MAKPEKAGGSLQEDRERKQALRIKSSSVVERLEDLHHGILSQYHDLYTFLKEVQHDPERVSSVYQQQMKDQSPFETFITYLSAPEGNLLKLPVTDDMTYPLSNYFISSSHNTYLSGNQLSSDASADGYRDVLLRGCRCVEIDVWNGKGEEESESEQPQIGERSLKTRLISKLRSRSKSKANTAKHQQDATALRTSSEITKGEPRVLHGYTLTKEVPFRQVCEAIRDTAFVNSDMPVIVSLEVHASLEQQAIMVDIMTSLWKEYLVHLQHASESDIDALPPPGELRKKLLIKVKYTAPDKAKLQHEEDATGKTKRQPHDRTKSGSSASSVGQSEQELEVTPKKKKKMLDSLSGLGIYTRSHHFNGFAQPEASIPSHVFSLSEGAVTENHETNARELFKHNQHYFMRTYPKGTRISSSNLNPVLFWRQGVQIVALNWQKCDKGTMLNEAMFAGTGGWVLKPPSYRSDAHLTQHTSSNLLPPSLLEHGAPPLSGRVPKLLDITIEFLAAQDIPLPPESAESSFRPYIKCTLHTETLVSPSNSSRARGSLERRRSSHSDGKADKASKAKQTAVSALSKTLLKGRTHTQHGRSPDLGGEVIVFKDVPVDEEALSFLRFKIEDDIELRPDDTAAWACYRLDRVNTGIRIIRLFTKHGALSDGFILVRVTKTLRDDGTRLMSKALQF